jgi:hypothetical protein
VLSNRNDSYTSLSTSTVNSYYPPPGFSSAFHVFTVQAVNSATAGYPGFNVDGTAVTLTPSGAGFSSPYSVLGQGDGDIAEIIFYNGTVALRAKLVVLMTVLLTTGEFPSEAELDAMVGDRHKIRRYLRHHGAHPTQAQLDDVVTPMAVGDRANIEKYLGTKYGISVAGGTAVDPSTVAGLTGWWKADTLLPPVAALTDGDPVSLWPDSNFRGHDATQTGTARPTFKTNIINGKPVVRFNSANLTKMTLASTIDGDYIWAVFAVISSTAGARIDAVSGDGVNDWPAGPTLNNDGNLYVADRTGYFFTARPSATFHVVTGVAINSGTRSIFVDGTLQSLSFGAGVNTGNFSALGDTNNTGDIAEVIIVRGNSSSTDRANIEKYLGTKYGITVAGGTAADPSTVAGLQGWWKADTLSSFDPTSIAGCKLWLKADALALSDGAAVTAWNDSSSNAYNVSGTATYKTNIVNGKPVVRFNGTSNYLQNAAVDIGVPAPYTIFLVPRSSVASAWFLFTNGPVGIGDDASGNYIAYAGNNAISTVDIRNAFHVLTVVVASNNATGWIDGTLAMGPTGPNSNAIGVPTIFSTTNGGTPYAGDMAEVLIYNSVLSVTDRQNVEAYLKAKYAIP